MNWKIILSALLLLPMAAQAQNQMIKVGKQEFRDFNKNGKLDVYEDYRQPARKRAENLLSQMTMQEKLVQLQCPWMGKAKLFKKNKFNAERAMDSYPNGLGEVFRVSDGNNFLDIHKTPKSDEILALRNAVQQFFVDSTRLGIPVMFGEEAMHGLVIKDATLFPSALALGSTWNEQLYIRDKVSLVTRPVKELKDFARITLKPGETKTVTFNITPDKLSYYGLDMKEIVEPGEFDIMLGPSSADLKTITLTVK